MAATLQFQHERTAHHAGLHRPDRFVLSVMGDIRVAMEELMDAMAGVVTHDRAPILPCNGFAKQERSDEGLIRAKGRVEDSRNTHITFPMSRKSTPGLQIAIAASRASLVVRINFLESSSISPTGYVAFRSPWKPIISQEKVSAG